MLDNKFNNKIFEISEEISKYLINFKKNKRNIDSKWENNHLKTNIDLIINKIWINELRKNFPTIPIISEEINYSKKKIPESWTGFIIDPIDGTRSYVDGFNGYVSQIAFVVNGFITYSLIAIPENNSIYSFFKNKILFNNKIIKNKNIFKNNFTIIDNYPKPSPFIKKIMNNFSIHEYVESGSIGLKLFKISNYEADLCVKPINAKIWDIAPAIPFLKYKDFHLLDFNGNHYSLNINNCPIEINGIVACSNSDLAIKVIEWIKSNNL